MQTKFRDVRRSGILTSALAATMGFIFTGSSQAATIYVNAASGNDGADGLSPERSLRTLAKAVDVSRSESRDVIRLAAGTYDEGAKNLRVPENVSIVGAGQGATFIRGGSFDWSQSGFLHLESKVPDGSTRIPSFVHEGNTYGPFDRLQSVDSPQEIAHLTLDGRNQASAGIRVGNRNGVKIHHVEIRDYTWAGILSDGAGYATIRNLEISDFFIRESSKEDTGYSFGNITLRGTHENLVIKNGRIEHLTNVVRPEGWFKGSGYAIKALRSWEDTGRREDRILNSKISYVTSRGKDSAPWANYNSPNISFEFWNIAADGVEISNCDVNASISLEFNGRITSNPYSFWVHHNRFKPIKGGALELANSNMIVEYNYFDLTENTNPWNVLGEFNSGNGTNQGKTLENNRINHNIFNLGAHSPSILVFTTNVNNFRFVNNTVVSTGSPTLFEFRRSASDHSGTVEIRNNILSLGGAMNLFSYVEGSNGAPPSRVELRHNLIRNPLARVPANAVQVGNIIGAPDLNFSGAAPVPYFAASSASANFINRGENVGLPTSGVADIGAVEFGLDLWNSENPPAPVPAPVPVPTSGPIPTPAPVPSPTVVPVDFHRAVNLNGNAISIDGLVFESSASAGISLSNASSFSSPNVELSPATDSARATMIRSSVWGGDFTVEWSGIPNGEYDVYLYNWEDNSNTSFSVDIEGTRAASELQSGSAGTWRRLGPYSANIRDGALSIRAFGGDTNLSGVELYRKDSSTPVSTRRIKASRLR